MRKLILALFFTLASSSAWAQCTTLPFTLLPGTVADGGQVMANFNKLNLDCGGGVTAPATTTVGDIPIFNDATGKNLADGTTSAKLNLTGSNLTTDASVILTRPNAVYQMGGTGGPYMFNDTALDTISFQALPGAPPSGNATNVQIYPPSPGGIALLNVTALASLSPPGEERLIIGTLGAPGHWIASQVYTGSGTCHDWDFLDGGPVPVLTLVCNAGGNPPAIRLGFKAGTGGVPIVSATPSNGDQGMIQLASNLDLELGTGANIGHILTFKPLVPNLPLSCAGQITGTLWNNASVVNVCP